MKVLVTGISGRIGANLAKALVEAGHEVRGLVWAGDRRLDKLSELNVELVEGTLTDEADVTAAMSGVEAVCHLGAAFQGGGPFTNDQYFEINVRGTFHVLEAAKQRGPALRHIFFASSDALYEKYVPNGLTEPIREDEMPLLPRGHYAVSKHAAEALSLGYARTENLPLTVFRFALTVAGEEILDFPQFYLSYWRSAYARSTGPGAAKTCKELERAAATHGDRCLVVARDETGRSYKKHISDVHDIVAGFLAALENPAAFGQVFQLAAPSPFTWEEAVPYLADRLGLPWIDVRMAGHVPTYYEFDLTKGARLIGYQPTYDLFRMIDMGLALRAGQPVDVVPTNARRDR